MKNVEVYKTYDEAKVAFDRVCNNKWDCSTCKYSYDNHALDPNVCFSRFLYDEYHVEYPKECPFCGSSDVLVHKDILDEYLVVCKTCNARGASLPTQEYAIAFWNRRSGK